MPLLILGFVFVVGLFIYYLATTSVTKDEEENKETGPVVRPYREAEEDGDIKKEENIIFITGDIESMKEKYKHKK